MWIFADVVQMMDVNIDVVGSGNETDKEIFKMQAFNGTTGI